MKQTLWTKNYTTLIAAPALGCIGNIAGDFAISFLVYDETGSVLASALTFAIGLIPGFVIPLVAAPWMDRLPRKPFLVWDDAISGALYLLAGAYLLRMPFTYSGYLVFKLLISSLGALDSLAYDSIYPKLIPSGMEKKLCRFRILVQRIACPHCAAGSGLAGLGRRSCDHYGRGCLLSGSFRFGEHHRSEGRMPHGWRGVLLWLPYSVMLINREICGFLGTISGTLRQRLYDELLALHLEEQNAYPKDL